jgi:hypothetical protein
MADVLCRAVANAVYNNVVSSQLQLLPFTDAQRTALLTSALDTLDTLSSSEKRMATEVLADGLRKVYIMFTVIAGTTLVCAFFIQVRPGLNHHCILVPIRCFYVIRQRTHQHRVPSSLWTQC